MAASFQSSVKVLLALGMSFTAVACGDANLEEFTNRRTPSESSGPDASLSITDEVSALAPAAPSNLTAKFISKTTCIRLFPQWDIKGAKGVKGCLQFFWEDNSADEAFFFLRKFVETPEEFVQTWGWMTAADKTTEGVMISTYLEGESHMYDVRACKSTVDCSAPTNPVYVHVNMSGSSPVSISLTP